MKSLKPHPWMILALVTSLIQAHGQQSFQNLDFESPILPLNPDIHGDLTASTAIPGWTPYVNNSSQSSVAYDTVGLGSAMISFHDMQSPYKPIQGNCSVLLQSCYGGPPDSAGIGQSGTIPSNAKSISCWGSDLIQVSFAGSMVPVFYLGDGPSCHIMAADISAFAGLTGELRFTQPYNEIYPPRTMTWLDNIQFSTEAVPEPSTLALLGLGGLAFLVRRVYGMFMNAARS